MKKMKHTLGPWTTSEFPSMTTVEIVNEAGLVIAEVGNCSMEDEANARLIAAAPELLEALQDAMKLIDAMMPGMRYIPIQDYAALNNTPIKAHDAIAKATGWKMP